MLKKIVLLALLCASPAMAQGLGELPVDVVVIKPKKVYLVPGGETKNIRIQGSNFDLVERVEVLLDSKKVPQLRVELKTISRGIYTLLISADKTAAPSEDYRVRVSGKQDYMYLPLDVQVIDPAHPPEIPLRNR